MTTHLVTTTIERNVSGSWSDISSYVVGDLDIEYLIPSNDANELLASVGQLRMVMDNGDGLFSPSSVFQRGTPIRVTTTYDGVSKVRFLGTLLHADPDTEEWGDQYVDVTAVDWMNFAINFPMIIPEIQTDVRIDEAVAYILARMKQPEAVAYHGGTETFTQVFDTVRQQTKAYTELNKLALSEFSHVYMKGDGTLVVESSTTRNGLRELTFVPVRQSDSGRLLKEDGGFLLQENGDKILLDQIAVPNLSGTFTGIEIEHGKNLVNQVSIRAYPSRTDESPVILFQLDAPISIPSLSTVEIKGTWANPDGGGAIAAQDIQGMVTGTDFQFLNDLGQPAEYLLVTTEHNGSEGFVDTITNTSIAGRLMLYTKRGYGIYPYNPVEVLVSVTGSVVSQGVSFMQIDQKYQDDILSGRIIADIIADDEKNPRNRVMHATFDASLSADLMQASQYMDIGDLTYVSNVKPFADTYAYIHGKKIIITPAGIVNERWYLKEMDSLKKGLKPIALNTPVKNGTGAGVDFGKPKHTTNLTKKTITAWHKNTTALSTYPPLAKYDGTNGWYFFILTNGRLQLRQNFTPNDGTWETSEGMLTGTTSWQHIAVSYDNSSADNDPIFYVNGLRLTTVETATPSGVVDTDENANLIVGNLKYPGQDWFYNQWGTWKDVRLYNKILPPAEIANLASNHLEYRTVTDGLVFQAPAVKTEDFGNLTGTILNTTDKLIDAVYGIRGTPNWNNISGTTFAMKAYDIT